MINDQYKKTSIESFKKMNQNYPGSFFRGSQNDTTSAIVDWIKNLLSIEVKESEILDFTDFIINDCKKTRNISPEKSELQNIYNEFKSTKGHTENLNDIEKAIQEAYKYFIFKYDKLFRNEEFTKEEHFKLWSSEIISSNASAEGVVKATKKVKTSSEFNPYPPNISQFVMMCIAFSLESEVPMADEAFNIAVTNKNLEGFHPIISHVRSIIGYQNLIQNLNFKEKIFKNNYNDALIKLFNGQLNLIGSIEDSQSSPDLPLLSHGDVANELMEILKTR